VKLVLIGMVIYRRPGDTEGISSHPTLVKLRYAIDVQSLSESVASLTT
jgi:hypothetical protein